MIESIANRKDFLITPQFQFLERDVEELSRAYEIGEVERFKKREELAETEPDAEKLEASETKKDNFTPTPLSGVAPSVWDEESVSRPYIPAKDEIDATAPKNIEDRVKPQKQMNFTENNLRIETEKEKTMNSVDIYA